MITILHEHRETTPPRASADGESLWLHRDDIEAATGWAWKPEGLCQADTCLPLPRNAEPAMIRDDHLDIAAVWRHLGQPLSVSDDRQIWALGTGSERRASTLADAQAPDFILPDLKGQTHRLSDYRGSKIFLATWASW